MKRTSNHSEQRLFREEVLSFTSHIYMTLATLCRRRHKVAFKSRTESEIQFAIPSAKECLRNGISGKIIRQGKHMIIEERMSAFINSFDRGNTPFLDEIEKEALETQVPIIRKSMQSLLKFLLVTVKPKRILEVGTAVGFSALLMDTYSPEDCRITTIEKYEKRIPVAKENFRRAGAEDRIELLEGDAAEILKTLEEPYDMIFMDAAKGQYIHFMPEVLRLLKPGGLLISDNVLQDGDIIESRFAVTRRNRTIHARMREYLYELTHHTELETVILPVGDGVTLSTRK